MRAGYATVIKHTGSHYLLSELPKWAPFPAVLKGKIRLNSNLSTNPLAVGDKVAYETDGEPSTRCPAAILRIEDRKNYIIRKSVNLSRQAHVIAANIDRAFIIVTIDFPEIKLPFLDRILVTCEVYGVPASVVLNKSDLYTEEHAEKVAAFHHIYESAGYPVIDVSAVTGYGIENLRNGCKNRVSLFSGVSGVGKSSLVKSLDPTLNPKTAEISDAHLQGRHTTTFYEMYPLKSGGFIIDTPGIRGFGLVDIRPEETARYFPEMLRVSENCRFIPCTHTHEPGCAVKAAVESGEIAYERYLSYLGMFNPEDKYRR